MSGPGETDGRETGGREAGFVYALDGGIRVFVPAEGALRITSLGPVAELDGLSPPAIGIALADGEVVIVLRPEAAERSSRGLHALLCDVGGERFALIGGEVVASGAFARAEGGAVLHEGALVPRLDLRSLHVRAEAATLAARVARRRGAPGS